MLVCVSGSVGNRTSLINRLQLAVQRQETHASSGHRAHCTVQRRTGHHHVVSTSHLHEAGEYCSFIETFIWISSTAVSLLSQDGHVPMLPAPVPTPAVRWLGCRLASGRTANSSRMRRIFHVSFLAECGPCLPSSAGTPHHPPPRTVSSRPRPHCKCVVWYFPFQYKNVIWVETGNSWQPKAYVF